MPSLNTRIQTPKQSYTTDYPMALDFVNRQMGVLWFPDEVKVEKDIQDILVNMTEAERHGVLTTLKLFTLYEIELGTEYWGGVVSQIFPRPDIQRMANCFSFFELNVHAPFYAKINQLLNIDTDDFYMSYLNDPVLNDRIKMIEEHVRIDDPFGTLLALALSEGVILYSNFAFLKHFQQKGKNKLLNIVRGINLSSVDEGIHSEASVWLCKTLRDEVGGYPEDFEKRAHRLSQAVYEHECAIIDKIFSGGKIDGITDTQLRHFVESRINKVLADLELPLLFKVEYNPIASWFYDVLSGYTSNDFFSGQGNQYRRTWAAEGFVWNNSDGGDGQ